MSTMSCWTTRRSFSDRCHNTSRTWDPSCEGCCLRYVDSQGLNPEQRERIAARKREQAQARARQLREDYAH